MKENEESVVNVYAIYDTVADSVGPLFEAVNDGVAARSYRQSMAKAFNAGDYQLICIGEVSRTAFGQIMILPAPRRIVITEMEVKE